MLKADLLALEQSNHDAMVAAMNQIVDPSAPSPDPLQVQLDAANAALAAAQVALQAEVDKEASVEAQNAALANKISAALAALQA